ncbi:SDR family oxidoreductase [Rhizobium sp. CFBP 8762]|uniref:SDR family oxidoreductase n=1 Tax=Rhizobium sp. CFBP 8762 TaxID=2775279 RepID=UPI001785E4CF|nr:SDR family oxidoreductase [Rhizobium sp. CFBP 8762]MBD8556003.1 SDR family oxidoreductase [Rhizobium sp. CFBP 8762]
MKMSGNTILITGGASGIGRELAERFHAQGNTVIIAGRRKDRLDDVAAAHDGITGYVLDIDSNDAIQAFAAKVIEEHPDLNVLINNAGIMMFEDLTQSRDLADAEATITTNLLGPIRLTNALIDHLVSKPDAAIVNVSSGLAYVPLVATPTYSATKAAIHSYTVSLRDALKGKVDVIELAPPAVQTELTPGQSTRPGYLPLNDFMEEVMTLFAQQPTPPEILVEKVGFLRFAEAEKRFDHTLSALNSFANEARKT